MSEEAVKLGKKKQSIFMDKVKELLPDGGNLNLCLTCFRPGRDGSQKVSSHGCPGHG